MASRRILVDTVDLYNYIGEVDDVATFQKTVIRNCYCEVKVGIGRTKDSSRTPQDRARLYIFDKGSTACSPEGVERSYLPYEQFMALDAESKASYWTLCDEGDDYILKAGYQHKFKIIGFSYLKNGSQRMWHFEVDAQ